MIYYSRESPSVEYLKELVKDEIFKEINNLSAIYNAVNRL